MGLGQSTVNVLLVAMATLTGCGPSPGEVAPEAAEGSQPAASTPRDDLAEAGVETLRGQAQLAIREQRLFAPEGNSAIDYYLALTALSSGDEQGRAALSELQPYLIIAIEQAVLRQDYADAERLLGFLSRIDASAPALSRLEGALSDARASAELQVRQAELEQQEEQTRSQLENRPPGAEAALVASMPETSGAGADAVEARADGGRRVPLEQATVAAAGAIAESNALPSDAGVHSGSAATSATATVPERRAPAVPRLIEEVAPRYPLSAFRRNIEGSVSVVFTVQPDGSVADVSLVSATPKGVFDRAAIDAVRAWRFAPSSEPMLVRRTLNFSIPAASGRS